MSQKWAVITGASSGIGWEFAKALSNRGYSLLLTARREKRLTLLESIIKGENPNLQVKIFIADITNQNEREKLIQFIEEELPQVDLFVNNAGKGYGGEFHSLTEDNILSTIDLNIVAATHLFHYFIKKMILQGYGSVINVSSTAAFQPLPYLACYSATKSYLYSLSMAVAEEVKQHNIKVMVLCPGPVSTEFQGLAGIEDKKIKLPKMRPEEVVKTALNDLEKGKLLSIPGIENKISSFLGKITPHNIVTKVIYHFWKR